MSGYRAARPSIRWWRSATSIACACPTTPARRTPTTAMLVDRDPDRLCLGEEIATTG
jgi:hypothetical protein